MVSCLARSTPLARIEATVLNKKIVRGIKNTTPKKPSFCQTFICFIAYSTACSIARCMETFLSFVQCGGVPCSVSTLALKFRLIRSHKHPFVREYPFDIEEKHLLFRQAPHIRIVDSG